MEQKDTSQERVNELLTNHSEIILAQTSPQQKLIIVVGSQRQYEDVAVTELGINNSPALKKENIAIAIGVTGSDAARNASHTVLLNDNDIFASIAAGWRKAA